MSEICEIGKCRQNAVTESMSRAREMYDTLQKNDQCEENETIDEKFSVKPTLISIINCIRALKT